MWSSYVLPDDGAMRHQFPLTGMLRTPSWLLVPCQVLGKEGGQQKQVVTDADRALYACKLSPCCPRGNQHHIWAACPAMSSLYFRQFPDSSLLAEPLLCPTLLDSCTSGKAGFPSGPEGEQCSKPAKYTGAVFVVILTNETSRSLHESQRSSPPTIGTKGGQVCSLRSITMWSRRLA